MAKARRICLSFARRAGKRCIDVGCGSGPAGLALHRVGAAQAVLADGDEAAVANCLRNARLNGCAAAARAPGVREAAARGAAVAVCRMQWEEVAPEEDGDTQGGAASGADELPWFDVAVASDVLYDPACVGAFVRLLARLLLRPPPVDSAGGGGGGGACAYVATTLRQPATLALFEERAAAAGLGLERLGHGDLGRSGAVAFQETRPLRDRGQILLHRITGGSTAIV